MFQSRNVKCSDCKDIFRIEYDSRKKKQDVYTCKCGKLKCYPDHFGGFSYDRDGNYEELSYEEKDYKFIQYEEDYIKLSDKASFLLTEINEIGKKLSGKNGIFFYNVSNENYISLELSGGSDVEGISIKVDVKLQDDEGWKYFDERMKQEKRLMESLTRFKDILIKVGNDKLDLSNPQKIWDDESLEWHDGSKTQQKLYDYELIC